MEPKNFEEGIFMLLGFEKNSIEIESILIIQQCSSYSIIVQHLEPIDSKF